MIVDERKMKGGGGGEKKKKRKKISYARLVSSLTAASLIMRDCELEELGGGGGGREGRRGVIKEDNIDGGVTKSSFIRCVKFHSKTRKEANRDPITALYK